MLVSRVDTLNPEYEAVLADSVGLALQVVLETLTSAERLAFVLHDMFDVPLSRLRQWSIEHRKQLASWGVGVSEVRRASLLADRLAAAAAQGAPWGLLTLCPARHGWRT
jgi:hypothetical protein